MLEFSGSDGSKLTFKFPLLSTEPLTSLTLGGWFAIEYLMLNATKSIYPVSLDELSTTLNFQVP